MARISSRTLFLTTSPRTPSKMIPEIRLLAEHFLGKKWNKESQGEFMEVLKHENFFNGKGEKDPAFSARDRINRAPKSLGFVKLSEMEGEPVSRHLGKLKVSTGKPCYCLFIAPTINNASIAFFYMLQKTNLSMYGGKSTIVPLPLKLFQKMVEDSYKANYTPNSEHIRAFFEYSNSLAQETDNEEVWYEGVSEKAMNWLGNI